LTTALDLDGSKVCVQAGTTTELNLRDFFKAYGMKYEAVAAPGLDDAARPTRTDAATC
jgi:general L-amino acid transport system substrate-binding protein